MEKRGKRCRAQALAMALSLAAALSGCATFDAAGVRQEQTRDFTNRLDVAASRLLAEPLTLDASLAIAMTNNYEVRKADLDAELARLGRRAAFSAFLPQVSAKVGYYDYRKNPLTTSQEFDTEEIRFGMPIFMPSTWFLYAATRHGYAAGRLSAHYTRQSIALKTTQGYFGILVQQDLVKAYEAQLEAAASNAERVRGLADEGFFAKWEGDRAAYLADARQVQLDQARRQLAVLRARFLADLGLPPSAPFALSGDAETAPLLPPGASLDELVVEALANHPLLSIADRQVVMKEDAVRQAFCEFLPTLSIFGAQNWTGNDVMSVAENWVSGFSGAWTLFKGFANVAGYQSSKVERRKAELERENTFLSIIVNVASAEAALRDAVDAARIRQRAYDVAAAKYEDFDAKSREGLIPLGDALDALAEKDLAQVDLVQSRYQAKVARAALAFAVGAL